MHSTGRSVAPVKSEESEMFVSRKKIYYGQIFALLDVLSS